MVDAALDCFKRNYPNGEGQIRSDIDKLAEMLDVDTIVAAGALFYARSKVEFKCSPERLTLTLQVSHGLTNEQAKTLTDYVLGQ